jgi:Lamin Tail Domain/Bacterial Ig-like domain
MRAMHEIEFPREGAEIAEGCFLFLTFSAMNFLPKFARLLVITTSLLKAVFVQAQVQDNFSDGDFSTNPTWQGSDSIFVVNTGLLKLQAYPVAAKAYLYTPSQAVHNASWEFFVRMDFNPSSTNYARIYLMADQSDFTKPLNGYYVMVGNTADEVSLYRQTGSTLTKIIDGLDARINSTLVSLKIKVTRDAAANWQLFSDVGSTGTYSREDTVRNDLIHTASNYMGVQCTYTATRSDKFWFGDFVVSGAVVPDLTPPQLLSVEAIAQNKLVATFNDDLQPSSAQLISNYALSQSISVSAATLQLDNKSVLLDLASSMTNGVTYTLQASGVRDIDDNLMTPASHEFLYFVSQPVHFKDVIVSEFMADQSPVVGLPETEFVEFFNRSSNPIDLQGWKLSDGTTVATLPHFILMPDARCIVAPSTSAVLLAGSIGVTSFPSLNNAGDNIIVKNAVGLKVDSITYTLNWYKSDEKKDGGWSLEIVDPENLCEEEGNWTASENANGGTPGGENSVHASNPDVAPPEIVSAIIASPTILEITFNEKLDGCSIVTATAVPDLSFSAILYSTTLRKIILTTTSDFLPSTNYTITLSNVFDCPGNAIVENTANFILPEAAAPNDIRINEILFNPKTGGVDFVEVFNVSNKHINLKKWSLANWMDEVVANPKLIEGENLIIPPQSFLVFSTEPSTVKAHYPRAIENVFRTTSLPTMSDDEGSIALVDSLGNVMDSFLYRDDFHVIFLKDKEGVSLERVSLSSPTQDPNNWRSASQAENFATPGYKNSSSTDGLAIADGEVIVDPEIFSPQVVPTDFTTITYRFSQSGFVANASIYDHQGRVIKSLANNEVLGTEGFFRWDGDRDDGGRARAGYYVAFVEVFNATGQVSTFRKRVVVAYR